MKQLGVNMIGSGSSNGISWGAISDNFPGPGQAALGTRSCRFGTSMLNAYLNAMEQSGVMKTLAEPTLTAVSGEKATFKVGGEFNLVTSQDVDPDNQAAIDLRHREDRIRHRPRVPAGRAVAWPHQPEGQDVGFGADHRRIGQRFRVGGSASNGPA